MKLFKPDKNKQAQTWLEVLRVKEEKKQILQQISETKDESEEYSNLILHHHQVNPAL